MEVGYRKSSKTGKNAVKPKISHKWKKQPCKPDWQLKKYTYGTILGYYGSRLAFFKRWPLSSMKTCHPWAPVRQKRADKETPPLREDVSSLPHLS
jgi:hypothetical protein